MKRSDAELRAEVAELFAEFLEHSVNEHDAALVRLALMTRSARAQLAADYWRFVIKLDPKRRAKRAEQSRAWRTLHAAVVAVYNRSPKERARKAAYRATHRDAINARAAAVSPERRALLRALSRIAYAGMPAETKQKMRERKRREYAKNPDPRRRACKKYYDANACVLRARSNDRMRESYAATPEKYRERSRLNRLSKKAAGLCTVCKDDVLPDRSHCATCLAKAAARRRAYRDAGRYRVAESAAQLTGL